MTWQLVLWTYITLLVAGGAIGFIKAGSKVSLITSVAFAIPLVAVALGFLPLPVALVVLGALVGVMGVRFAKSKKFMPAGMIAVLSVVALIAIFFLTRGA